MDLPNIDVDVSKVTVLIGQYVPQAHVVLDYSCGDNPQNQPYAMKTPFGWSVAGPTGKKEEESNPIALSSFEFDFGRHCPEVVYTSKLNSSGLQRNTDLQILENVLTVLKIEKPLKVLNARLHL